MINIIVTARALIIDQGELLMCKLKPHHDFHCLPGGKLDPGETVEACLVRELMEETGIKAELGQLAFVNQFINADNHRVEFFFLVRNGADFRNLDHTTASHGFEINSFTFGNPADPKLNLLPSFIGARFPELLAQGDDIPTELVVSS